MKGSQRVIEVLNQVLKSELTSVNQYFLHAEMCENWGYLRLASIIRAQSVGEMKHAEALVERILFLDGAPNMSDYFKINVGSNVIKQMENDLALEKEAHSRLNEGIGACQAEKDSGSRRLLEIILKDEEAHIDWLEAQLHAIEEIGLDNYLAQQIYAESGKD